MTLYDYIEVALVSCDGARTTTEFTYAPDGAYSDWAARVANPGAILDYFLNAREAYLQWTTKEGNFFAIIFRNPFATRDGYYMIAMKIAAGYGLTGRQVVRSLGALRKKLVEERRQSVEAVDEVFASYDIPRRGKAYDSWRIAPTFTERPGEPPCYRTYVSMLELENFITFPRQEEYSHYREVIYVSATTSLRPGVELHHVVTPIKNIYTIVCPEGVDSSRPAASAGDRIMLSYSKPGFATIREAVVVGRPSMFVNYDGATMTVKSAQECRLNFIKRIPLTVKSAKGGVVTGYTVSVNGRPVNTMEPFLEVTESELNSTSPVVIQVSSTNFEVYKTEMSATQLNAAEPVEIELRPIEQGITLRLDFGEGRVFEQQISIEKNTPEYSQLHSGNFHGFRAHRLAVGGRGEIYNVDVRSSVKPTAPSFTNVSAPRQPSQATAPAEPQKPAIERAVPTPEPAVAEPEPPARRRRRAHNVGIILGVIIVVGIIAAAGYMLRDQWMSPSEAFDPAEPTAVVEPADIVDPSAAATAPEAIDQQPEEPAVPAAAPADLADDRYLNSASSWVRDSLTTESGRQLYDDIVEGRIAEAAANPYFATPGRATNTAALKLIDMLWKSATTPTEKSNQRCMEKYRGKAIDLKALYEDAARYQPGEPNTAARPGSQQ